MKDAGMQNGLGAVDELHEGADAAGKLEQLLLAVALIHQLDANAVVEEGQLAQALGQDVVVELDVAEHLRAGHEVHLGAAPLGRTDLLERRDRVAIAKLHLIRVAVAADGQTQPFGQCVDHRHADPVQPAGDLVGVAVELAAGVQHGHHDLGGRTPQLVVGMDLDGDAAAVVDDADRVVGVDDDLDVVAVAGQGLVDRVVDHLEHHVVQAGAVAGVADVHARPLAHGFQPFQDLDAVGVVVGSGCCI